MFLLMRFLFSLFFILFSPFLFGTGLQFLSIPSSAQDLISFQSSWRNPAFVQNDKYYDQIGISYGDWFADIRSFDMKWNGQLKNKSSQLSFRYIGINDIELRPNKPTSSPLGYYSSFALSVGGITTLQKGDNIFGLGVKAIHFEIYQYSSSGYSMDFGFNRKINNKIDLSLSILNMGNMENLLNAAPRLPTKIIASSSYRNDLSQLSFGVEKNDLIANLIFHTGFEAIYHNINFGINYSSNNTVQNLSGGISFGIGIFTFSYGFIFGSQQLGMPQFIDILISIP